MLAVLMPVNEPSLYLVIRGYRNPLVLRNIYVAYKVQIELTSPC
jgi:hypothetical protein